MKIIRVEPVEKSISLTWMIGAQCNYDCMYCPSWFHNNDRPHHTLEDLKTTWLNFYSATCDKNLPYKISFTGGEVTANKHFLPLVAWLRSNYSCIAMIMLTTNGSASESYYKKLCEHVESISFSTHSEFMDERKFFNTVISTNKIMIRPQKSVHVNIMDEYWNQPRIALYKKLLTSHNISHTVNAVDYDKSTRTHILKQGKSNLAI